MNVGSMRIGQAQGFHIGFLSQLRGLRTTDGRSTLLHFLVGLAERKFPHILDFQEDLSACSQAARGMTQRTSEYVCYVTYGNQYQGRLWRWK